MGSMRRFSNDTAYKQTKEADERYKATFFAMALVILPSRNKRVL